MRKPLLKRTQIIRLGRLLDMLYRPAELAEEIGLNVDTIYRSYMPAGLPYQRDGRGNIWIHGPDLVAWAKQTVAKKKAKRAGLPEGQAWCLKCKHPVPLLDPIPRIVNRYLELLQAPFPTCGTLVNRARARQLPSPNCVLPLGEGRGGGV
jgi:hypothetical protein